VLCAFLQDPAWDKVQWGLAWLAEGTCPTQTGVDVGFSFG
jgi:hypothetical protein